MKPLQNKPNHLRYMHKVINTNDLTVGYKVGEIRGAISVKEKFE